MNSSRQLTSMEQSTLARRLTALAEMDAERPRVLLKFAEAIGLDLPDALLESPDSAVQAVDEFLRNLEVTPENQTWLITGIGYFLGHLFASEFHGTWSVDRLPSSRYFLRVVVGEFEDLRGSTVRFDPFEAAALYAGSPVPRELSAAVQALRGGLLQLSSESGPA